MEIVKKRFAKFNLTYYPEQTVLMAVPYNNIVVNCYLVYTNNPDAYPGFDIPYYEHLVAIDGSYLTIMPTTSFATPGGDAVDNSYYFEGMRVQTLNKTVQLNDGTTRELSVPVCFNPRDNKYYLMDPDRPERRRPMCRNSAPYCRHSFHLEPDILIDGLRILYGKNKPNA